MTVTQSLRHELLVLHLSHLTPHRNEHKLIPVELQEMSYCFYFLMTSI